MLAGTRHEITLTGRVVRTIEDLSDRTPSGFAIGFSPQADHDGQRLLGGDLWEFFFSTLPPSETAFRLRDIDGRPLGELNTPEGSRRGTSFEVRECPYSGTRFGKLMNVTGLSEVTAEWSNIVSDLHVLRLAYVSRLQVDTMTVGDLWLISQAVSTLPNYLVRSSLLGDRKIPRRIASLFKSITGIAMTARRMLMRGMSPGVEVSPDDFIKFTDDNRVFNIGDRACSGPPHLVEEFVALLIEGKDVAPSEVPLQQVIGDVALFLDYALSASLQHVHGLLFRAYVHNELTEVRGRLSAAAKQVATDSRCQTMLELLGRALSISGAVPLSGPSLGSFEMLAERMSTHLGLSTSYRLLRPIPREALRELPFAVAVSRELRSKVESNPELVDELLPIALSGLAMEQGAISTFTEVQRSIARSLKLRGAEEVQVDKVDVSAAFRPTIPEVLSHALGVQLNA